jgi:hypothetical protein
LISLTEYLDGDDWQNLVIQLLFLRHGSNLIEVPDRDGGDRGIEAFTTDGCAFQCYSPKNPGNVPDLAAKHKAKISRDIRKFHRNRKALQKILGDTKVSRWIFIVPDHCSAEVVELCQKKTEEIRNLVPPLPYVTEDFQVLTVVGSNFLATELAELSKVGGLQVEAGVEDVSSADLIEFARGHNEWIENLDLKLSKLSSVDEPSRKELRTKLLQRHLEGENALDYYDNNYPVVADRVRSIKQARAKALEIDSKLKSLTIAGSREDFEAELINSVPALGRQTAAILSYASITEWLMICPLDPKG